MDAAEVLREARRRLARGQPREADALATRAIPSMSGAGLGYALMLSGIARADLGALDDADERLVRARAIFREHPGDRLAALLGLDAGSHLADVWTKLGRLDDAERLLRELLAEIDAAQHPRGAASLNNLLGVCLRFRDQHAEAEAAYARARRHAAAAGAPPSTALIHNLGGLAAARGEFDAAERHARDALARHARSGAPDFVVAMELGALADALAGQGRRAEAEVAYREALDGYARSGRDAHPEIAYALHNLGDLLAELGRVAEAEAAYRESIARKEAVLGAGHHEVAATLANLAVLLADDGRAGAADEPCRRALGLARATLPEGHSIRRGCEEVAASLGVVA